MATMVQVRLNTEMQEKLERAARRLGWSRSEILREGIRLVEISAGEKAVPRLIGIGMFGGGPSDLSTNKKYLKDLGLKSMGRARKKPVRGKAK
jgi:hypothetical protein